MCKHSRIKKEVFLVTNALVTQDPVKERRLLQLRNHIEMFRGALCAAEPFFMGIRLMLGDQANADEIMDLVHRDRKSVV